MFPFRNRIPTELFWVTVRGPVMATSALIVWLAAPAVTLSAVGLPAEVPAKVSRPPAPGAIVKLPPSGLDVARPARRRRNGRGLRESCDSPPALARRLPTCG